MRQFYLYYIIDLCAFYELHSTLQECQKSLAVETCGQNIKLRKKTDLEVEVMMV